MPNSSKRSHKNYLACTDTVGMAELTLYTMDKSSHDRHDIPHNSNNTVSVAAGNADAELASLARDEASKKLVDAKTECVPELELCETAKFHDEHHSLAGTFAPLPGHKEVRKILSCIAKESAETNAPSETPVGEILLSHIGSPEKGSTNLLPLKEHPAGNGHELATPDGESNNVGEAVEVTKVEAENSCKNGPLDECPEVVCRSSHGKETTLHNDTDGAVNLTTVSRPGGPGVPDVPDAHKNAKKSDTEKSSLEKSDEKHSVPLAAKLKENQWSKSRKT